MRTLVIALALSLGTLASRAAQSPSWDVTAARGTTREVAFEMDEGTFLSVDLSPDGRFVVFDLLGHIYRLPSAGGDAVCLTQDSGVAWNMHPRYSPDGEEIAFVSDRGGQSNLWMMKADGSSPRPVHVDLDTMDLEPAFSPDGRHIAVKRRYQGDFGTGKSFYSIHDRIWIYPSEGGEGKEAVNLGDRSNAQWPSYSPDGKHLYFYSSTRGLHHVRRLDLASGALHDVSRRPGMPEYGDPPLGEIAPEPSPDGRYLAFTRKMPGRFASYRGHEFGPTTALWLRDLQTGEERLLIEPITFDRLYMVGTHVERALPGYAWARDSRSLVLTEGGKIRRVWVEDGRMETIPFRAKVRRTISQQVRANLRLNDDSFEVKNPRWAASSPNGKQVVFEAAGQLFLMDLPSGRPRLLTSRSAPTAGPLERFEMTPSWSSDGKWIVYATWSDEERGHVYRAPADASAPPTRLTTQAGRYLYPAFDATGVSVNRWDPALAEPPLSGPAGGGIGWQRLSLPTGGGAAQVVGATGVLLRDGPGADGRLWLAEPQGAGSPWEATTERGRGRTRTALVSTKLDGSERQEHLVVEGVVTEMVVSPDRRQVAFAEREHVHVLALPERSGPGEPLRIEQAVRDARVKRLSAELGVGYMPRWWDSTTVEFLSANRYVAHDTRTGRTEVATIALTLPTYVARGRAALTGTRIVGPGNTVIERGTIVVDGPRIACVGQCDSRGARVFDVSGTTIVAGFVDMHAHYMRGEPVAMIPQHHENLSRALLFGTTTALDPSSDPAIAFPLGEMVEAGRIVGPRFYNVGHSLASHGGDIDLIESYEDADRIVRGLAARGAPSFKSFAQPRRQQRQWLIEAARRYGLTATTEGREMGILFGVVMDGATGWEHWLQYLPAYRDTSAFMGATKAHYSIQLYGAGYPQTGTGDDAWFARQDYWLDEKLRLWTNWRFLANRRTPIKRPEREYPHAFMAEGVADAYRAGAFVPAGGHGELAALDMHWEVWSRAYAMKPLEVLDTMSRHGAHFIGLEDDTGSLSVGLKADLMVVEGNPLDNIRASDKIRYVMKDGRLYDGNTLDEVWPESRPYGPRPWLNTDQLRLGTTKIDDPRR